MNLFKFFFLLTVFYISSCNSKPGIKNKIIEQFENQCYQKPSCLINLRDVTNFKWDKTYLFKEGTTLEDINAALGFQYPYFEDIAERIVFVYNNKVVYHEDQFYDPDSPSIAGLIFQLSDSIPYYSSDYNHTIFTVKKKTINGNKYYELYPQ
jgi:sulfur carrier protein ThiS